MDPMQNIDRPTVAIPINQMLEHIPLYSTPNTMRSLSDQAYEHILKKVVFPDDNKELGIEYGGKITESVIAKALKMSNGPVREAIFRLRQEGWIKTLLNRGSYLVDFCDRNIALDIYRFRLTVEAGAFYTLASSITDEQLSEIRIILDGLDNARKASDTIKFRASDIEFHLKVVEFAGGESFKAMYRPKLLQWYAMSYHILMESMGGEKYKDCLEGPGTSSHDELFELLVKRDNKGAAESVTKHFRYIAHLLGIEQVNPQDKPSK